MNTEHFEGYLIAQSPIHHGGDEKVGNESLIRRESYMIDNQRIDIPVISGNAIRGILRRMLMADMLQQIDYKLTNMNIYHMLFTGGMLEAVDAKDSGVIDLQFKRDIRRSLPPIAVLGTAIGNQMFEGKLKCMMGIPICTELKDFLPENTAVKPNNSIYEFISSDFQTRRDDIREAKKEDEAAHQMLVNFEVLVPGTVFYHSFVLMDASVVEKACLARALNLWRSNPFVGGKSGTGYGKLKIEYELSDDSAYIEFLKNNQAYITEMINVLEAR